jgi:pilus assembly protein CpaD
MRRILTAAALSTTIALAACGPVNRGLESVHQPVVTRASYALDVSPAGLRSGLDSEARRVDAWFDALELRYGDRVSIDDPAGSVDRTSRDAIADLLARRGLALDEQAPVTAGAVPAGTVRIVVARASADVPNCPNWERLSQPEFAASTMSNYGCGVNGTLAAMVANPEDLIRGQTTTHNSDARAITKAVQTYRDAKPTASGGLKNESTQSGVQ